MKFYLKVISILVVCVLILLRCGKKEQTHIVKIKVEAQDQKNKNSKIIVYKNLGEEILAETQIDSLGNCYIQFELSKPIFSSFQIGDKYSELYLFPGCEMNATTYEADRVIHFTGNGAKINNYLSSVFSLTENIKMANGKFIGQLELVDFNNRFDSLKETITTFHKNYTDSVQFSQKETELLKRKNQIKLLTIRQEYAFSMYNNYLYENRDVLQSGKNILEFKMPIGFENVTQEVPFDTASLNLGMFEYTYLCQLYLYNSVYNPNSCIRTKSATTSSDEVKSDSDIKQRTYPDGFHEYLLAKNIQYWLTMQGITTGLDTILNDFKSKYKNSVYLDAIQNGYNEWLAIAPGSLAPDFTGTTYDGKSISLTNFKGKVVYIDVWATWCGPCLEEIPASKKIQAEFEQNPDLEFLNVSVDRDIDAWRKFIEENPDWKGIHVNQKAEEIDSFWKSYKMAGVPTYILIDQQGKIVDANAKRPSDENIRNQIQQLLQSSSMN